MEVERFSRQLNGILDDLHRILDNGVGDPIYPSGGINTETCTYVIVTLSFNHTAVEMLLVIIFRHSKLELLTQFPASNEENIALRHLPN